MTLPGSHAVLFVGLFAAACGSAPPPPRASHAGPSDPPSTNAADDTDPSEPVALDPAGNDLPPGGSTPQARPLDPGALDGPYGTLEEYLEANAVPHDEQCGARPAPSMRPHRIAGAGGFKEGRYVRAPGSVACAPVEHCVLGLRTAEGWFVRRAPEPCHGVVGPGSEVSSSAPKTSWVGAGSAQVLALEMTRHTKTLEVSERQGVRDEHAEERESRYLTLCGLGPSGKPSCTTPVVLSCPNSQGTTSEASWAWAGDQVTFESEAEPQSACEWDGPFVVGTFAIHFP